MCHNEDVQAIVGRCKVIDSEAQKIEEDDSPTDRYCKMMEASRRCASDRCTEPVDHEPDLLEEQQVGLDQEQDRQIDCCDES